MLLVLIICNFILTNILKTRVNDSVMSKISSNFYRLLLHYFVNETTFWACSIKTFLWNMFVRLHDTACWLNFFLRVTISLVLILACDRNINKLLSILFLIFSDCSGTKPISLRKMLRAPIGFNLGDYPNGEAEFNCARQEDSAADCSVFSGFLKMGWQLFVPCSV